MSAVALTIAITLVIAGIGMAVYIDRFDAQRKIDEITVQARILASTVTAALVFNDQAAAQEYVGAMRANPEIEAVAVYGPTGQVFVSDTRLPGHPLPRSIKAYGAHFRGDRLIVTIPVQQSGATIGTVYMAATTEPLGHRIERYGLIVLLVSMAALVVVVLAFHQSELSRTNAALAAANQDLLAQIEKREQAEDALRQAQKMEAIGQLTGGVAHDFNNLLQVILGNLDRLRRRYNPGDDSEQAKAQFLRMTNAAIQGAQRAAQLTQRMLAFSRRQPLEPTQIDVSQLISGMSDMLERTLGETITLRTVLANGLWQALADENQLENAILNLAVNARDAMGAGGALTIEAGNVTLDEAYAAAERDEVTPGQYVMIAVGDTGSGIPQDVLGRVFEPFFTTKSIGEGTGLGLSQVYGFVKQSGGHVKIHSEQGRGTTVRLYLPRVSGAVDQTEKPAIASGVPRGQDGETILVVEDEAGVRQLAVETLRDLGYRVLEAEDGHAALAVLEQEPGVHLLFTDVGLPGGLNGKQLSDLARKDRPALKVLFTTGYARNAIVHHGRLDPGVELITKPFPAASLGQKVRELLDGQHGR
jgi:signal transduction histidine kinase/CheY-like chemotaxis protein